MTKVYLKKIWNSIGKAQSFSELITKGPSAIEAYWREWLYFEYPSWLPKHQREQFTYRLNIMPDKCLYDGHCQVCGCTTPSLQFTNRSCERNCYPSLCSRKLWNEIKIDYQLDKKDYEFLNR